MKFTLPVAKSILLLSALSPFLLASANESANNASLAKRGLEFEATPIKPNAEKRHHPDIVIKPEHIKWLNDNLEGLGYHDHVIVPPEEVHIHEHFAPEERDRIVKDIKPEHMKWLNDNLKVHYPELEIIPVEEIIADHFAGVHEHSHKHAEKNAKIAKIDHELHHLKHAEHVIKHEQAKLRKVEHDIRKLEHDELRLKEFELRHGGGIRTHHHHHHHHHGEVRLMHLIHLEELLHELGYRHHLIDPELDMGEFHRRYPIHVRRRFLHQIKPGHLVHIQEIFHKHHPSLRRTVEEIIVSNFAPVEIIEHFGTHHHGHHRHGHHYKHHGHHRHHPEDEIIEEIRFEPYGYPHHRHHHHKHHGHHHHHSEFDDVEEFEPHRHSHPHHRHHKHHSYHDNLDELLDDIEELDHPRHPHHHHKHHGHHRHHKHHHERPEFTIDEEFEPYFEHPHHRHHSRKHHKHHSHPDFEIMEEFEPHGHHKHHGRHHHRHHAQHHLSLENDYDNVEEQPLLRRDMVEARGKHFPGLKETHLEAIDDLLRDLGHENHELVHPDDHYPIEIREPVLNDIPAEHLRHIEKELRHRFPHEVLPAKQIILEYFFRPSPDQQRRFREEDAKIAHSHRHPHHHHPHHLRHLEFIEPDHIDFLEDELHKLGYKHQVQVPFHLAGAEHKNEQFPITWREAVLNDLPREHLEHLRHRLREFDPSLPNFDIDQVILEHFSRHPHGHKHHEHDEDFEESELSRRHFRPIILPDHISFLHDHLLDLGYDSHAIIPHHRVHDHDFEFDYPLEERESYLRQIAKEDLHYLREELRHAYPSVRVPVEDIIVNHFIPRRHLSPVPLIQLARRDVHNKEHDAQQHAPHAQQQNPHAQQQNPHTQQKNPHAQQHVPQAEQHVPKAEQHVPQTEHHVPHVEHAVGSRDLSNHGLGVMKRSPWGSYEF